MIEIFKLLKQDNPIITKELFQVKTQPYNLRNDNLLRLPAALSTNFGANSSF